MPVSLKLRAERVKAIGMSRISNVQISHAPIFASWKYERSSSSVARDERDVGHPAGNAESPARRNAAWPPNERSSAAKLCYRKIVRVSSALHNFRLIPE
jgi:hypothetical protein